MDFSNSRSSVVLCFEKAVQFHNTLDLDENDWPSIELMSRMKYDLDLKDFRTWGHPAFVLDHRNQSGIAGTLKWYPKSREVVHLGRSPLHDSNVDLFLNLKSSHVSPQYTTNYLPRRFLMKVLLLLIGSNSF